MDGNKDDAVKALRIGKDALDAGDTSRALKFLSKAKRLDPLLPIDHLLNPLLNKDDPSSSPASSSSSSAPHPPPPPPSRAASSAAGADGLRERKQKGKKKDGEEGGGDTAGVRTYTEEQLEVIHQIKKRFDLVGSDEPPAYNRRAASTARSYNGFYEDDIDPDEIFRNFFFGGMAPATTRQFGTFHFRTGGMHHAHGVQQGSGGSTVRMLVQLLPVLLLLLLNFLPSSEPVYSLSRSYPYEHKFQTQRGVTYYVKLPNFEDQYPHQSTERTTLERHVERDYYSIITQNCRVELQRRQWGLAYQTPHCDMLQKFEATAQ
ncbi:unnamed protein product [Triticum turgidum subsp. durum]|uniref:DUF1977 domain-containing protein n=1 Tax=Triticum turgidum subsp. durum TaxID=4567 RepID=A0A9R1QP48_TRITD|nr:unnamed protein product [Triticum turgidum subsp. durum]